jgi:hypothetical protein
LLWKLLLECLCSGPFSTSSGTLRLHHRFRDLDVSFTCYIISMVLKVPTRFDLIVPRVDATAHEVSNLKLIETIYFTFSSQKLGFIVVDFSSQAFSSPFPPRPLLPFFETISLMKNSFCVNIEGNSSCAFSSVSSP